MKKLKYMAADSESLSKGLKGKGSSHKSYKMYTSMERALGVLLSGYIYLSNGNNWNDVFDRSQMKDKKVYGTCFSCSTTENIAMWMLYSADHGKSGAMLNFYPSVMSGILTAESIEIGCFDEFRKFKKKHILYKANDDYEIFLSDVVYTEECKNGKVNLTVGEDHITSSVDVLNGKDIFHKNYAWSYEKECRLIVRVLKNMSLSDDDKELSCIRIKIPDRTLRKMKEDRLIRSPLYEGGVSNGTSSVLSGKVDWDL